jgi:uncharacterized protein YoaH (UPF0181 family)
MADIIEDAKDTTKELLHRTKAEAERLHRQFDGDDMSAGERIASVADEMKERAQAGMDKAKREIRNR